MNTSNNFKLERYRSGGANRYTCPQCGRKKCFTRYVDISTNEYVDETCGKCDHESSCGYHYPPREFFRDNPDAGRHKPWEHFNVNGKLSVLNSFKPSVTVATDSMPQTQFFDIAWARKAAERRSTFRTWFENLPFDSENIQQVLADYYVGATQKDTIVNGINYGPAVVFWLIDEQQRVHDAKLMAYSSDGHRVQGWGNSMRSICERTKRGPQLSSTEKVLFGLHLLSKYPEKTVCIVESEKTALICALQYPDYLWLATGGCGNLQASKLLPLMNRKIVIYPDSGEYKKWVERMKRSRHLHYTVVDLLEDYELNTDIADIILGVAEVKPF